MPFPSLPVSPDEINGWMDAFVPSCPRDLESVLDPSPVARICLIHACSLVARLGKSQSALECGAYYLLVYSYREV